MFLVQASESSGDPLMRSAKMKGSEGVGGVNCLIQYQIPPQTPLNKGYQMQPSHSELYETGDPSYFLSLRMSQALHTARE